MFYLCKVLMLLSRNVTAGFLTVAEKVPLPSEQPTRKVGKYLIVHGSIFWDLLQPIDRPDSYPAQVGTHRTG